MCIYEKLGEDGFPLSMGRLDELSELSIEDDLSTRKITTTGDSKTTAKTGNAVKRAVVGGVLLGGTGAVIGGITGTKDTKINTQSVEEINYLVNARLRFKDGKTLLVQINNADILTYISSYIGAEPISDEALAKERELALVDLQKIRVNQEKRALENQAREWAKGQIPASRFSTQEAINISMVLSLIGAAIYVYATNDTSIWWWLLRLVFWTIIFAIPLVIGLGAYAQKSASAVEKKIDTLSKQRLESLKSGQA